MLFVIVVGAIFLPHYHAFVIGACAVLLAAFFAWATSSMPRQTSAVSGLPETIGEHFKRKQTLFLRIAVPLCVAWVVVWTFYPAHLTKLQRNGPAIGGAVVLMIIAARLLRIRCPRCHTDFSKERIAKVGRWSMDTRGTEELWDACPHCGVRFDERWTG